MLKNNINHQQRTTIIYDIHENICGSNKKQRLAKYYLHLLPVQ